MFRWIPESLAWLELKGRRIEARKALIKVARVNGQEFDDILMEITTTNQNHSEQPDGNFLQLCKYKRLKKCTIAITIVW